MNGTKNEARKPQEDAISYQTMLELMGLPSEAKKKLALMLVGEDQDDDQAEDHRLKVNRIEPESLSKISNTMLDLSLKIKYMKAVAECFADEYIDTMPGITRTMAVALNEDHYERLFNAMFGMIATIDEQAETLQKNMDEIYKSA